jgi:hypothetical protein
VLLLLPALCAAAKGPGGSGDAADSNSSGARDAIGLMNEMTQFMSQFDEAQIAAAYAGAAEALQGLQDHHQQQIPLRGDTQQSQQQQSQRQQSKVPPTALNFLKVVLQRAQERSSGQHGLSDPLQYLKTDAGKGLVWEVLKGGRAHSAHIGGAVDVTSCWGSDRHRGTRGDALLFTCVLAFILCFNSHGCTERSDLMHTRFACCAGLMLFVLLLLPLPLLGAPEQFTAEETTLLDAAFGSNWQQFGQQQQPQLDLSQLWKVSSWEPDDMGKLYDVLDKMNVMNR